MRKLYFLVTTLLVVTLCALSTTSFGQASHLVISQVYGGGGATTGSPSYKYDYVELYNPTATTISLNGWSLQYGSATGTGNWSKSDLPAAASIAPGQYFLVRQGGAGTAGGDLPIAHDATGSLNIAAASGKIALVNNTIILNGACPVSSAIIDLVGFGTANCSEGGSNVPALSTTTAAIRKNNGCTDTDNNAADFVTGAPTPRNTASPTNSCISCTPPTNQATGLSFTATANTLSGSFTAAADGTTPANAYLVLVSTSNTLSAEPVPGAAYATGSPLGNATVVSSSSATSFTVTDLLPATTYYFFVYAYNTTGNCYNKIAPLSGSATTGDAPTASVAAGADAAEPATPGTFTLSLSEAAPAGGLTLTYSLSGSATQGDDFSNPATGTLTIPAGSSAATFTIAIVDDAVFEGPETITFTLTGASHSYVLAAPTASINVQDNEKPTVVINQVYGGGGNSGALYTHDFIELYNYGSAPVSLEGWSVQYTSATGTGTWGTTNLSGSIPAHSFYLVQEAKGSGGTKALPAPDATGTLNMSGSTGKVILSNATTPLSGGNPASAAIIDKVGFGSGATVYETAPAPATENTTSVRRIADGVDTDNNATDFATGDPLPRNTSYTTTPPVVASLTPPTGHVDAPVNITPMIVFDKPVQKGTGHITLLENGVVVATIDVASASVELTDKFTAAIHTTLAPGKTYAIQVAPGAFTDVYGNGFAGISNPTDWTFTTYNAEAAVTLPLSFDFNNCPGNGLLPKGFTRYNSSGAQQWDCSTFGRNSSNGVQMNGFDGETNVPNVDWLISPKIDLTGTTYPLLSFWSITAFNGKPLQLKISTNYTGGDPAAATWTDLNGKFPAETSNAWTESKDINLARFKSANVHIAFVYTSSDEDGARWTLDDISLINSTTPPPPSLTVGTTDLQLGYAAKGSNADKAFTFTGNDLVEDVTLVATAPFLLSKDGSSFASSVTYTASEANNLEQAVWVRFAPTEKGQDFSGTATVSTSGLVHTVALKGTSINPEGTLEVVNWNVEWFGSTEFGPADDDRQEANVLKVFKNLNADIYALGEVVSEERLQRVVNNLPGYAYVIGNFGSHTNTARTNPEPLAEAQKLAFVYKTSVINNLNTRALLSKGINSAEDLTNIHYNEWSSGRFPFLMQAEVTLNCVTRQVNFVLVHAKANTSPTATSYARREAGAQALHDSLNVLFPEENVVILGDFNDDLDQSITAGKTTTSWSAFTNDNVNYTALTLPLSLASKKSTVSHNDVIDHVVVSNDMAPYYMEGTASIVTDVTGMVSNYGSTTSDHYPVFTRYRFEEPAAPAVTTCPESTTYCVNTTGSYTVGQFAATATCGAATYSYEITGATVRSGTGNDASGAFGVGVSTITWTATDVLGNSSTCQTTVTVHANPSVTIADAFALPAGTRANTVYIGYSPASSLTLAATASEGAPDYSYTWQDGTTGASLTVSPTAKTTYTVTATDANGCTATASKEVSVMDVRGGKSGDKVKVCHEGIRGNNNLEVETYDVPDHLAHGDQLGGCSTDGLQTRPGVLALVPDVQPNPSRGAFTIGFRGGDETRPIQLIVTDLVGRVVEKRDQLYTGDTFTLGGHYHSGIYLVTALHNGERYTLKLVKQ